MTEEFNLSEKIIAGDDTEWNNGYIPALDVKEFIKRLKQDLGNDCTDCNNWNIRLIDKLVGDKLI